MLSCRYLSGMFLRIVYFCRSSFQKDFLYLPALQDFTPIKNKAYLHLAPLDNINSPPPLQNFSCTRPVVPAYLSNCQFDYLHNCQSDYLGVDLHPARFRGLRLVPHAHPVFLLFSIRPGKKYV